MIHYDTLISTPRLLQIFTCKEWLGRRAELFVPATPWLVPVLRQVIVFLNFLLARHQLTQAEWPQFGKKPKKAALGFLRGRGSKACGIEDIRGHFATHLDLRAFEQAANAEQKDTSCDTRFGRLGPKNNCETELLGLRNFLGYTFMPIVNVPQ